MFNGLIMDGQVHQDGQYTILFVVQFHADQEAATQQVMELKKLLTDHCEASGEPYGYSDVVNGQEVGHGFKG